MQRGEPFFFAMGLILVAIVIGGFVPLALSRPGGFTAIPFLLHVHGAVFLSWFLLFCYQARLVGAGNVRLHMKLGKASIGLAVAMAVLGYAVMHGAYARPDFSIAGMSPAASMMFPFTDIVNFVIAYSLAFLHRRNAPVHKRLMLIACILIIDPAAARLVGNIGGPWPAILGLEMGLFLAVGIYDVRTRRRPSWPLMLGVTLFVAAMVAKLTVAQTPGWAAFVERILA